MKVKIIAVSTKRLLLCCILGLANTVSSLSAGSNLWDELLDVVVTHAGPLAHACPSNYSGAVAFKNRPTYARIDEEQEDVMAQEPLATKGNFLHIYDFRVTKGKEDEFIRS